ncbi:hypothetical protein CUMW_176950, partial [Citrus unshiu]
MESGKLVSKTGKKEGHVRENERERLIRRFAGTSVDPATIIRFEIVATLGDILFIGEILSN